MAAAGTTFLTLPREIRNKIYALALGGDVYRLRPLSMRSKKVGFIQLRENPLGLLLVCRQIYQEARLLPFTSNTFSFNRLNARLSHLTVEQLARVRHIRLETFRFMPILEKLEQTIEGSYLSEMLESFAESFVGVRIVELLGVNQAGTLWPKDVGWLVGDFVLANGAGYYRGAFEDMAHLEWPEASITSRLVERIDEADI